MRLDTVTSDRFELGEGAIWDSQDGRLYWVNIAGRSVHWLDETGEPGRADIDHMPGTLVPHTTGRVLLATDVGFETLDTTTGATNLTVAVESDQPLRRMNDGKCDPFGRLLAGTMNLAEEGSDGILYRLESDGGISPVLGGLTIPNGLAWPEPDRMYYIDSPTRKIDLFEYPEHGSVGQRIRSIDVSAFDGVPDGMTLDADGNLWVAFHGGSAVRCFAPSGKLTEVVQTLAVRPTSCAFGGPDLDILYITTAYRGLEGPSDIDGALLCCRGLSTGRPAQPWLGLTS